MYSLSRHLSACIFLYLRRRAVSQPDVDKKAIAQKLAKITPQDNDRKILSNALTHAPERIYQLLVAAVTSNNQQWASQSEEVDSLLDENVTLKMLDGTIRGPGKNDVRAALNDTVKVRAVYQRIFSMLISLSYRSLLRCSPFRC